MPIPLAIPLISAGAKLAEGLFGAEEARKKRAQEMENASLNTQKEAGEMHMKGEQNAFQSLMNSYGQALLNRR